MGYKPTRKASYIIDSISAIIISLIATGAFYYLFDRPPIYISGLVGIIFWTNTTLLQAISNLINKDVIEKIDKLEKKRTKQ